jgi:GT2 family glycosyltransferase
VKSKSKIRKCIMILGMHRSGTSAYAGVLNKLGISFGQNLMAAKEDNERGFFENQLIYEINESILRAIDSSWDDVFPLPSYWWKQRVLSVYRNRIIEVFDNEFEGAELFGIKDPRMCILFPYWQDILKKMRISPSFVIPIRHPLEVAQSLEKRNGLPIRNGIFLWMKYMMDAEYHSRGFKRVLVSFDKLLFNTEDTIGHVANTLGLNFPWKWEDEKRAIEDFLDAEIKHHYCKDDAVNHHMPQYVGDYYRVLLNIVSQGAVGNVDQLRMDTFRKKHLDELRAVYRHHNGMTMQTDSATIDIGGVNTREMEKVRKVRSDTPMEVKQVSIVVVNYNGRKYLEPLFNSLLSMDRDNVRVEIIMVDNLSGDDSVSLTKEKFPEIIIVENEVNNFARALNLGIEYAGGDYIAFLNNDVIVDKKWLEGLLAVIDGDEQIGAVQSKILFSDGEIINSVGVEDVKDFYFKDIGFDERDHGQYQSVKEIDYFTGGSVLLRRACIESVGSIDEDFIMFFEDIDYSIRCRKAGWKLFYSPKSVVYHKYHGSASSELSTFFCSRNRLLCLAKHFPLKLPGSIKTSDFYVNHEHENLYQSLIQAARKLIADHSADTSLKVLAEIKDIMIEIYESEMTYDFFSQIEVLTGLKQIKMGIYDHLLKFSDAEMLKAGELVRKPSFYLNEIAGAMYMSAMLDRPVLAVFNQVSELIEHERRVRLEPVNELTANLKESEADRAARLEQINKLTANLKESEADRAVRLEQINKLTANLKESEADRAIRLEQINELTANLKESEADRAVRLEQINELTANLKESEADRAARFDQITELANLLKESETDRAARLEVIHSLGEKIDQIQSELAQEKKRADRAEKGWRELEGTFAVRQARRVGFIKSRKFASREFKNED